MCASMDKKVKKKKEKKHLKYNKKKLIKYMHRAYNFVRDLEYFSGFPTVDAEDSREKDGVVVNGTDKQSEMKKQPAVDVTKRLRGLSEIEAKLKEIKGKKLASIQELRYKKNLKTRLTKQQKKEKRKLEKSSKNKNKIKLVKRDVEKPQSNESEVLKKKETGEKVFNKECKMVFNRFDFSGIGKENSKKVKKQEKDPKYLLEELKKSKSKLNELEQSGEKDKAKELREKQMWTSALKKAEGIKVKDDPNLLKKTMRKQNEIRNRRQRKWESRVEVIEKKKEERQKKRQENIAAKKKEKKQKKIKRSVKKGRIVL